jgi:hypothetical protein
MDDSFFRFSSASHAFRRSRQAARRERRFSGLVPAQSCLLDVRGPLIVANPAEAEKFRLADTWKS